MNRITLIMKLGVNAIRKCFSVFSSMAATLAEIKDAIIRLADVMNIYSISKIKQHQLIELNWPGDTLIVRQGNINYETGDVWIFIEYGLTKYIRNVPLFAIDITSRDAVSISVIKESGIVKTTLQDALLLNLNEIDRFFNWLSQFKVNHVFENYQELKLKWIEYKSKHRV